MMDSLSPKRVATLLRGGDISELLTKPVIPPEGGDEPEYSQAQIIADVINVMRLDNQALAEQFDVDVFVTRITEERVAEMLSDSIQGDPTDLVETFNELEAQRDRILREVMDEDDYEEFIEFKQASIATCDADSEDDGEQDRADQGGNADPSDEDGGDGDET